MQRLLFPYIMYRYLVGFKRPWYREHWGYDHYGADFACCDPAPLVRASGDGLVLAADDDDALGFGVAILYKDCYGRDGTVRDLVARYMHLDAIICREGDRVIAGDAFAREGAQGTKTRHLHMELDTDTRPEYAAWTPQVSTTGHTLWRKGIDTCVDPMNFLWEV